MKESETEWRVNLNINLSESGVGLKALVAHHKIGRHHSFLLALLAAAIAPSAVLMAASIAHDAPTLAACLAVGMRAA